MLPTPRRSRRAFTVVELLMVIVIISVIAGFAIVGLSGLSGGAGSENAGSDDGSGALFMVIPVGLAMIAAGGWAGTMLLKRIRSHRGGSEPKG